MKEIKTAHVVAVNLPKKNFFLKQIRKLTAVCLFVCSFECLFVDHQSQDFCIAIKSTESEDHLSGFQAQV